MLEPNGLESRPTTGVEIKITKNGLSKSGDGGRSKQNEGRIRSRVSVLD